MNFALLESQEGIAREIFLLLMIKIGIVRAILLLFLKKKELCVQSCYFFSYMQFSISAKSFTTTSAPASTRLSRVPLP